MSVEPFVPETSEHPATPTPVAEVVPPTASARSEGFAVDLVAPERLSLSFMRAAEACLMRAEAERTIDTGGPSALIGRVFHEVAATVGLACSLAGLERPDAAEAVAIAHRVMANPEEPAPLSRAAHATVIELVEAWVSRVRFRPGEQFEVGSRIELAGRVHSARIDRLHLDGDRAEVRDYKSGFAGIPTELPLQGEVYGWHVLCRHPEVREVTYVEDWIRYGESEPFVITREMVPATEAYLIDAAQRIDATYAGGELPATPGQVCSKPTRCPVARFCPVPVHARPATELDREDDARHQVEAIFAEDARLAERKAAVRGYLDFMGERAIEVNGREIGYAEEAPLNVDRKRALSDAQASGVRIDLGAYTTRGNPGFGARKAR